MITLKSACQQGKS